MLHVKGRIVRKLTIMKPFDISSSKGNRAATRVRREKLASDKEVENNKALAMSISSVGQNWYY